MFCKQQEQIPKAQKKTDNLTVFFALSGSVCVKAAHRMLIKLTPISAIPVSTGTVIKVKKFKANRLFEHKDQQKQGGGQRAKSYMRLLRPTETRRGQKAKSYMRLLRPTETRRGQKAKFHSLGLLLKVNSVGW